MAADPLSALKAEKKKEVEPAKAAPQSAGSLFGVDVESTLGRARQLAGALGASAAAAGSAASAAAGDAAANRFGSDWAGGNTATPSGSFNAPPRSEAAATSFAPQPSPLPQSGGGVSFDDMLPAEKVVVKVDKCHFLVHNPFCEIRGRLLATNFRIKFQSIKGAITENRELKWIQDVRLFDVPMGAVEEVKVQKDTTTAGLPELKLKINTKDLRSLVFILDKEDEVQNIIHAVESFSAPGNPTLLFAFQHAAEVFRSGATAQDIDGWSLYDPAQEYARMGIETDDIKNPACPWVLHRVNRDYQICSSYPSALVMPKTMSDRDIAAVAKFRKRGRLPAMSWCGGPDKNFASVWRCSQTTEGILGSNKSPEDEGMIERIRRGMGQRDHPRDLLVIDLRPWKSAWANKAGGGGFENYERIKRVFGGIDNIHCVREAWRAMGVAVNNVNDEEVGSWLKDVANSSWYDYIGAVLNCTKMVVTEIWEHKSNVLVHCSDGWDRTAQAASLAMLCLDPTYRTHEGFLKLVQKEWCSFGHRFRTRLALGEAPTGEYSPVFIQWLECVYQIWFQFQSAFEWSPVLLMKLSQECMTNRYGTFLQDNEQERQLKIRGSPDAPLTMSLWSVLLRPEEVEMCRNKDYQYTPGCIMIRVNQANYQIWEQYWFQWHKRGARLKEEEEMDGIHRKPGGMNFPDFPSMEKTRRASQAIQRGSMSDVPIVSAAPAAAPVRAASSEAAKPAVDIDSLFSLDEIGSAPASAAPAPAAAAAVPKRAAPVQVFNDDDDEDDIFTLKPVAPAKKHEETKPETKPAASGEAAEDFQLL